LGSEAMRPVSSSPSTCRTSNRASSAAVSIPSRTNRSRSPRQVWPRVAITRPPACEVRRAPALPLSVSLLHIGQLRRLILGDQRIDDFIEPVPGDDLGQLVEGQVDPVVGHPSLREIIGADTFRAIAGPHLALAAFGPLRGRLLLAL